MHDASPELRADRELVFAAVSNRGDALQHAADELKADKELVLAAVGNCGDALQHASPELRADREVVLAAVSNQGHALQDAAPELRADRELVLAAARQQGHALQHAAPALRADRELVLATVSRHGHALQHASPELQADREVVLTAVSNWGRALVYAERSLAASIRASAQSAGLCVRGYAQAELRPIILQVFTSADSSTGALVVTCCTLGGEEVAALTVEGSDADTEVAELCRLASLRLSQLGDLRLVLPGGSLLRKEDTDCPLRELLLTEASAGRGARAVGPEVS